MTWFFFFQAEDGIRDLTVTGVQTCALPISAGGARGGPHAGARAQLFREHGEPLFGDGLSAAVRQAGRRRRTGFVRRLRDGNWRVRSEEHTSELQSQSNLVCRLLLEKKKKKD